MLSIPQLVQIKYKDQEMKQKEVQVGANKL